VMKLTAFLLLAVALHVSAAGYSQKVTLKVRRMPLQKVFEEVITQTGVSIVYSEKLLADIKPVSLNVKDVSVRQLLDLCLKDQQITYSLEGNSFVIKRTPEPLPAAPPEQEDSTVNLTG